jgi:hypothetical protein
LWTGTLDLCYQPGLWPAVQSVALCVPLVWLAVRALRGPAGDTRRSPLALAMPFALLAMTLALAHPSRIAARLGWPLQYTFFVLALANVGGVAVAALLDGMARAAFTPRSRPRPLRTLYQTTRTALSLVAIGGLAWPDPRGLLAAIVVGPAMVAVNVGAMLRSRPIGRARPLGTLLPLGAWWLTAMLAALSDRPLWPAAVALACLYGFATLASWYQERPAANESAEFWPLVAHGVLLVAAALPAFVRMPEAGSAPLADGALRVAAFDVRGAEPVIARQRARIADEDPSLVLLLGLDRGHGLRFDDSAWWLSRRLGLTLRQQADGDLALLAAVPPAAVATVSRRDLQGAWPIGDKTLAAAVIHDDAHGAETLAKVAAELRGQPLRVIAASAGELGRKAGWRPPEGYRDPQTAATRPMIFLLGTGLEVISLDQPGGGVVSALLDVSP